MEKMGESSYLNDKEFNEYLTRYRNGEKELFDILYSSYLPLVYNIINRYFKSIPIPHRDLLTIGEHGLFKALYYFHQDKGIKFITYAYPCIYREIAWFVHEEMRKTYSLNQQVYPSNDDGQTFFDKLPCDELDVVEIYEKKEEYQFLYQIIAELSNLEKRILTLFYGLENNPSLSLSAIGKELNISRTYVTNCLNQALKKIKEKLKENGYNYYDRNKINIEELLLKYQDSLSSLPLINQKITAMYLAGYTMLEIAIQLEKNTRFISDKIDKSIHLLEEDDQKEVVIQLQLKKQKRKGQKKTPIS